MDKSSYTFQALSSKYEDFRGPAFTIKVDGTVLNSAEMPIASLEVDLCANGSAGGCRFSVETLYDFAQSKWVNDLAKTILCLPHLRSGRWINSVTRSDAS